MTSRLSAVLFFQRKCFSILPWVCAATERKIRSVVKVVSEIYIFKLPVSKEDSLGLEHTKSNFGVVRSCLTNFCNDFFSGYCPDIVRVVTEKSGPYVKQFRRYEISNFHCPKKAVWAQKTLSGILVHYGPVVQLLVLSFFLVLHWYNKSLKKQSEAYFQQFCRYEFSHFLQSSKNEVLICQGNVTFKVQPNIQF